MAAHGVSRENAEAGTRSGKALRIPRDPRKPCAKDRVRVVSRFYSKFLGIRIEEKTNLLE